MQKMLNFLNTKRFWRDASIGQKYFLALSISLFLFAASMASAYISILDIREDMNTIETSSNRSIEISEAITLLHEMNALSYDYMSFAQPSKRTAYESKMQQLDDLIVSMKQNLDPDSEAYASMEAIRSELASFHQIFVEQLVYSIERSLRDELPFIRLDMSSRVNQMLESLQLFEDEYDSLRTAAISNTYDNLESTSNSQIIYFAISILLGIAVLVLISTGIRKQMSKLLGVSNQIATGDLTVRSDIVGSKSEIGQLSESVNRMADWLNEMIRTITGMSGKMEDQSSKLLQASADMEKGSLQIADTMNQLASGTEEQAGSAGEISQVISELNGLILEANQENERLTGLSGQLLEIAGQGNRLMQDSMEKMNDINAIMRASVDRVNRLEQRLHDISSLIEVVQDIADRTNILSLNATIEAARAGDAGRGFAVVAAEVRKLAGQVAESLVSITEIVHGIQTESRTVAESLKNGYGQVDEGSGMIRLTGDTFGEIHQNVAKVTEGISRLGEHLATIAESSNDISKSVENIAAIAEQTAAGVEEVSASAQTQHGIAEVVSDNAREMSGMTGELKQLVAAFRLS
jgi:methyl-accepting chemotaxis protein